jgi:CRP-like cAMP-binding protein
MTTLRAPSRIIPRAFPGITTDEIEAFIRHSVVRTYEPRSILCRENEPVDRFFLILEGEAEVTKRINKSEERLISLLTPGDFFGERVILSIARFSTTVRSKSQLTTMELAKEAFEKIFRRGYGGSIAVAIIEDLAKRLEQNDQLYLDDLRVRAKELAEAYQVIAEQELARREREGSVITNPIRVFISYKHQDEVRNQWVDKLYKDLRALGIDAKLDRYEVAPGQSFSEYMTSGIREADYVLFIITPRSVKAVEKGKGALAFEMQISNARRLASKSDFRIIPIFREGRATSTYLSDHRYLDFRDDTKYESQLVELIKWLKGEIKPPVVKIA